MWENINKIRGKGKKKDEWKVYDDSGKELREEEIKDIVMDFWRKIFNMRENNIGSVWNEEKKQKLLQNMEEGKQIATRNQLREHMDMVKRVEEEILPQKDPEIHKEEVKEELENLENNKSPGKDELKPMLYKEIRSKRE